MRDTLPCPTCGGEASPDDPCETCRNTGVVGVPDPCTELARQLGCSCRMSSVHSASIDPPHEIINRECELHGSPRDPDEEMERRRDDEYLRERFGDDDGGGW